MSVFEQIKQTIEQLYHVDLSENTRANQVIDARAVFSGLSVKLKSNASKTNHTHGSRRLKAKQGANKMEKKGLKTS